MLFFCHGRWIEIFCQLFSVHQRSNVFSQTPGRRPLYITGFLVNSVTLGWVRAPNERAPLRVHDAIAVFAARYLTRTRIADQGGGHKHCAGFGRAIEFRMSCPGEFNFFSQSCALVPCILAFDFHAYADSQLFFAGLVIWAVCLGPPGPGRSENCDRPGRAETFEKMMGRVGPGREKWKT